MGRTTGRAVGMVATREALSVWRRTSGGRGKPIPEELWREATELARSNGIGTTARALRLDGRRLERRVHASAAARPDDETGQTSFVELKRVEVAGRCEPTVVCLVARDGDQVRVEVPASGRSSVDLVALARAFWSRGT